jgi:hypothetical protein
MIILTTRFDKKTLQENIEWKKKKNITTCAYGLTKRIPDSVETCGFAYVIEMVNDEENDILGINRDNKKRLGKIAGIGYIKNRYFPDNRSRIYDDHNYNRYVYIGTKYITRNNIIQKYGDEIIIFLEKLLFTGSRHFKRGRGMTQLTLDRIAIHNNFIEKKDLCKVCGLVKKDHICKGYRVKPLPRKNICHLCNKKKKTNGGLSHICNAIKKDEEQVKKVVMFFRNLFN